MKLWLTLMGRRNRSWAGITTWREKSVSLSGKVYRSEGGFAAPQRRNCRSLEHGSRRCLLQRHARADPLAQPEHGGSPVSTANHQRRRSNQRSHRRLALLGRPRLLLLSRCRPREVSFIRWELWICVAASPLASGPQQSPRHGCKSGPS